MRRVTERQREVMRYIADYLRIQGYSPGIREIGEALNIASMRGVTVHLDSLQRKGMLQRDVSVSRSIRLTESGMREIGMEAQDVTVVTVVTEVPAEVVRVLEAARRMVHAKPGERNPPWLELIAAVKAWECEE